MKVDSYCLLNIEAISQHNCDASNLKYSHGQNWWHPW